ncbi:MAG TPA: aldo/keto reductase [Sphingomonadaceae bacterium]|nr:aldo/keto reductase [Sphingomonadaceae bacterium]
MEKRRIGGSPLEIAPLMFGGNVFGWTADAPTSFALLDAFVDAGFNAIDTADAYTRFLPGHVGGESETVIGEWLARSGRRASVVIATKVGLPMGENEKGLSRAYIHRAVDASLRRLQTDYIDLYQSHIDDPSVPMEETLDAYARLIEAGKVRAIGLSNFSAGRIKEALDLSEAQGLPRYESLQPWYNLYDRGQYEGENEPLCQERGLGVISYFGLASGFLTGKYRSEADLEGRARGYRARNYLNDRGLGILAALDEVAARHGARPAQIALAWLMARPSITAPIASATNLDQLAELMAAARISLGQEDMARLDAASAQAPGTPVAGAGQPAGGGAS